MLESDGMVLTSGWHLLEEGILSMRMRTTIIRFYENDMDKVLAEGDGGFAFHDFDAEIQLRTVDTDKT